MALVAGRLCRTSANEASRLTFGPCRDRNSGLVLWVGSNANDEKYLITMSNECDDLAHEHTALRPRAIGTRQLRSRAINRLHDIKLCKFQCDQGGPSFPSGACTNQARVSPPNGPNASEVADICIPAPILSLRCDAVTTECRPRPSRRNRLNQEAVQTVPGPPFEPLAPPLLHCCLHRPPSKLHLSDTFAAPRLHE